MTDLDTIPLASLPALRIRRITDSLSRTHESSLNLIRQSETYQQQSNDKFGHEPLLPKAVPLETTNIVQYVMSGLLLPESLRHFFAESERRHEKQNEDFCQPIRLLNTTSNVTWNGFLFMFHEPTQRFFLEMCVSGLLRVCPLTPVTMLTQKACQWELVYHEQTALHATIFASPSQLAAEDPFAAYSPSTCDIDLVMPGVSSANTQRRTYVRDLAQNIPTRYPFRSRSLLFLTNQPARMYLCNIQGPRPHCVIVEKNGGAGANLSVFICEIRITKRDNSLFDVNQSVSEASGALVWQDKGKAFKHHFCKWVLQTWKKNMDECKAEVMCEYCIQFKQRSDGIVFSPTSFVHRLENTDWIGKTLMQYVTLPSITSPTRRREVTRVQIDLVHSDVVWRQFSLRQDIFKERGKDAEPRIMFHGVGGDNVDVAIKNIVQWGFDKSYMRRALYGEGIYCSPQFGCALNYVANEFGNGKNYVFVCLVLIGNVQTGGTANERLAPDKDAFLVNLAPHQAYAVPDTNIMPCALLCLE